ncbi:MAG: GspH/FimT family protein [Gemmatimonadetes bacterium]|nr:GspH/FimT family protein [Gemmatimonadota bacterium]
MTCAHPIRRGPRAGFSLIELLLVLLLVGLVLALAAPKFNATIRSFTARSATSQVVADLALVRTTAVREGRSTSLRIVSASRYQVVVDANGTAADRTVKSVTIEGAARGVALGTVGTRITFDSRGMRRNATQSITVTQPQGVDVVNVTMVGRVYRGTN